MSRCFPFPPPGYVKIGERGGEGPIETDSIKLQKEIKKAEKERKREKKREKKEKKELLKKQQGVSDGSIDKLDGKKSLHGDGKKSDFVTAAENQSRSGLSEEHGQAIPESIFYLSDDTDSSKKRKREEKAPPTVEVERKGTKLKLCFSFKKPSASETPSAREEPTCSTSSLQKPSVSESQVGRQQPSSIWHGAAEQPHLKKPRLALSQEPVAPKGDAKSITNRSRVRAPPLQKASVSEAPMSARGQSTLSTSTTGAVPQLQKATASKVQQHIGKGQPTLSVPGGLVRSHPGNTSLAAAAPSSSQELSASRDAVPDRGVLKTRQVQKPSSGASEVLVGRDQSTCSAPSQEILVPRDSKHKSDRKDRKRHRHESMDSMYKSLLLDWSPLAASEASEDDQGWLFGSKTQERTVPRSCNTDAVDVVMLDSLWPPRAHYLAAAEIHALPFTVPF